MSLNAPRNQDSGHHKAAAQSRLLGERGQPAQNAEYSAGMEDHLRPHGSAGVLFTDRAPLEDLR